MMNNLTEKVEKNRNIQVYLKQLAELVNKEVTIDDLSSSDEVTKVKSKLSFLSTLPKYTFKINADELKSSHFKKFINELAAANNQPALIWLHATNSCGVYKPSNLINFNFNFNFSLIPEGVIVFLTQDVENKLLLDFDEKEVQIEVQGKDWSEIKY